MTDEEINELAGNLECGFKCFIHKVTQSIIAIPGTAFETGSDSAAFWKDELIKIEKNRNDYHEIIKMDSRESFRLMENFVDTVDSIGLRDKLSEALRKPRPFRNFKFVIDDSGAYRQLWFDFKKERLIEWVKAQLNEGDSQKPVSP